MGPFRSLRVGRRHIHHFVPGIVIAFGSGAAAILTRDEELEPKLAVPFGIGMGLTLDESALLLELDDVYWSREGLLSVQITLAVTALLASLALGCGSCAAASRPCSRRAPDVEWFDSAAWKADRHHLNSPRARRLRRRAHRPRRSAPRRRPTTPISDGPETPPSGWQQPIAAAGWLGGAAAGLLGLAAWAPRCWTG